MSYIYLASPYSINSTPKLRQQRYEQVRKYVADCYREGEIVFSPILNSHDVAVAEDLPGTFDFWAKIDYVFIDACSSLRVYKMDMWDRSVGIAAELEYAKKMGKEIEYVDPA